MSGTIKPRTQFRPFAQADVDETHYKETTEGVFKQRRSGVDDSVAANIFDDRRATAGFKDTENSYGTLTGVEFKANFVQDGQAGSGTGHGLTITPVLKDAGGNTVAGSIAGSKSIFDMIVHLNDDIGALTTGGAGHASQVELNETQSSMGAMMNAAGEFVTGAFSSSTFLGSDTDLTECLLGLDAAVNATNGVVSTNTGNVSTNTGNITTIMGTGSGSITKAVADLVATAPATLDTLNELAAALGDDASFSTTVSNNIGAANTAASNAASAANAAQTTANTAQNNADAIETAIGAAISSGGAYVAHTGSSINYIAGNNSITEDLLDLDSAIKNGLMSVSMELYPNKDFHDIGGVRTVGLTTTDGITFESNMVRSPNLTVGELGQEHLYFPYGYQKLTDYEHDGQTYSGLLKFLGANGTSSFGSTIDQDARELMKGKVTLKLNGIEQIMARRQGNPAMAGEALISGENAGDNAHDLTLLSYDCASTANVALTNGWTDSSTQREELFKNPYLLDQTQRNAKPWYGVAYRSDAIFDPNTTAVNLAINKRIGSQAVLTAIGTAIVTAVVKEDANAVAAATAAAGELLINGVSIGAVTILSNDSDSALRTVINGVSGATGVAATVNSYNKLVLTAADGRSIILAGTDPTMSGALGFSAGTTLGTTIVSCKALSAVAKLFRTNVAVGSQDLITLGVWNSDLAAAKAGALVVKTKWADYVVGSQAVLTAINSLGGGTLSAIKAAALVAYDIVNNGSGTASEKAGALAAYNAVNNTSGPDAQTALNNCIVVQQLYNANAAGSLEAYTSVDALSSGNGAAAQVVAQGIHDGHDEATVGATEADTPVQAVSQGSGNALDKAVCVQTATVINYDQQRTAGVRFAIGLHATTDTDDGDWVSLAW
jgi:hypothetical protein